MTARKIPESVRRAIADPLTLGDQAPAKWTPPADLPPIADVRAAMPILRSELAPVPPKDAKWCLRKMAKRFSIVLDDDAQQRWMAVNGKLPGDLCTKATLAWMQGETMPTAEDFQSPVAVVLQQRKAALARTEAILARLTTPRPAPPFTSDPTEVRVRTLLKWALQRGDAEKVARYEREIAVLEGRTPAPLPSDVGEKINTPTERPPFTPDTSPMGRYLAEKASEWRNGKSRDAA